MYVLFYHASLSGMCCIMKVMQKWLRDSLLVVTAIVIASCSLLSISSHNPSKAVEKTDCSAKCSSHSSQMPTSINVKDNDKNDNKPLPPSFSFNTKLVNLAILYLVPVAVFSGIFYQQRRRLLSVQLRF